MSFYGPSWPLSNGERDLFKMNEDLKSQINFELKNLLMTFPGENISAPDYGVGMRKYIFEQNTNSIRQEIILNVQNQISTYMSYIQLNKIKVTATPEDVDNNTLSVSITYSIPKKIEQEVFNINITPETFIGFF